jgi:predicted transcriptional regulator
MRRLFGAGSVVHNDIACCFSTGCNHPCWQAVVADKKGMARKAWDLKRQSAAMAILDADGTELFFKEGRPTEQETGAILDMIDQRLQPSASRITP